MERKIFKPYPYAGGNFDRYDTKGKETVIPTGNTVVYEGDVLVQAKF